MTPLVRLVTVLALTTASIATLASQAGVQTGGGGGGGGGGNVIRMVMSDGPPTSAPAVAPGTAALSGVVVDGSSGRPISGAVVTLGPNGNIPAGERPRHITDGLGRFVFAELPAFDGYFLSASAPGYAPDRPGGSPSRVALSDGQWLADRRLVLWRLSSISGVVEDERGDPVVGVTVQAFAEFQVGGGIQLATGPSDRTDDRGAYRLGALFPGRYRIAVPATQSSVPRNASIVHLSGMTPEGLAASVAAGRPPELGSFVDADVTTQVVLRDGPIPPPPTGGRLLSYPTTFFQRGPSALDATVIDLARGESRAGVNIRLEPLATWRVSGRVIGPAAAIGGLPLRLLAAKDVDLGQASDAATSLTEADGSFTFAGVPPGSYVLVASRSVARFEAGSQAQYLSILTSSSQSPPGFRFTSMLGMGVSDNITATSRIAQGDDGAWARVPVDVGDRNVEDLTVELRPALAMTGQIKWEGAQQPNGWTVTAEPATGQMWLGMPRGRSNDANEFAIAGLLPGQYVLRVLGGRANIKTILWNGRDYTDTPFDASAGSDFSGVVVTMTDQTATIAGTIRTGAVAREEEVIAVAFPTDPARWTQYGVSPRRLLSASASSTGAYRFNNLPAGDYFVAAIANDLERDWRNVATLERLAPQATRVSVGWGETRSADLTPVTLP